MKAVHRSRPILRERGQAVNGQIAPLAGPSVSMVHTQEPTDTGRILTDLIATIGSTMQFAEIARRAAQGLASAGRCAAAFVYRWDGESAHLILSACAPSSVPDPATSYELGEQLVGRAALSASGALVGTSTVQGPPKGRARLSSVGARATAVATRLTSREGALLGVLEVALEGRGAPPASLLRTIEHVAILLGLAIEHERLRAVSEQRSDLLGGVELLARSVTGESSLAEGLSNLAVMALRTTRATACAVYVTERTQTGMRVAAVAPRGAVLPPVWRADAGLEHQRVDGARATKIGALAMTYQPESPEQTRSVLAAPAITGTERVGAIVVFDERPRTFNSDDHELVERLARMAAVLIRQRRLLDGAIERTRAEDLLWEIVGPGSADPAAVMARAQRLGCDLTVPRVVIAAVAEPSTPVERLRAAVVAIDRAVIVDAAGDRLVAILPPDVIPALPVGPYSIGVSHSVRVLAGYPLAYRQSQEALELGVRLFGPGRLVRYEDLGSYRFVPALIQCGLTGEVEYQQVSRLSDELLRTLEAYLDSGGNTALAAKQLFLHRNTLRQRLERISASLEIDLAIPARWLPLQLAIKTARMSRLVPPTTSGRPHSP